MGNLLTFGYEDEQIKTWREGEVGILDLKCSVYEVMTNLAESGILFSFFHAAEVDPQVTVLLLTSSRNCFCAEKFNEFFRQIKPRPPGENGTIKEIELRTQRLRYAHLLNRFVMQLADFKKLSALTLQKEVVTPIFGASLAADFRLASDDMVYLPAHEQHGVHPGGALPFFLPLYLGYGRASEILYSGRSVPATEALELGLVNAVVPVEGYREACVDWLQRLVKNQRGQTLRVTKMLLGSYRNGLSRYFEQESALIV